MKDERRGGEGETERATRRMEEKGGGRGQCPAGPAGAKGPEDGGENREGVAGRALEAR